MKLNLLVSSAERFNNEFIAALAEGSLPELQMEYLQADVLYIKSFAGLNRFELAKRELLMILQKMKEEGKTIILEEDDFPEDFRAYMPEPETRQVTIYKRGRIISEDVLKKTFQYLIKQAEQVKEEEDGIN